MQGRKSSYGFDGATEDCIYWNEQSSKNNHIKSEFKVDISQVFSAQKSFVKNQTINVTALTSCKNLSETYEAQIYFKREDQQRSKTCKIRGGYYYYLKNQNQLKEKGIVAVSDGNFATSMAMLAGMLQFKCVIFVPYSCFPHKIDTMINQGKSHVTIIQEGHDFQECEQIARAYAQTHGLNVVQPHSTEALMPGYATIAKEIIDDKRFQTIDYLLVPSGGGALASSIASFMKQVSPTTKVIAVQPDTCTPFSTSILKKQIVSSDKVSKFCNGSSVKKIGQICFKIGKTCVDGFVSVSQNKLAETIIRLYSMGYICEPSGALAVAGLTKIRNQIKGKNVVCLLSGSNMDLSRLQHARELNVISKGYKNYYIIEIPNKKKAMYDLLTKCFRKKDMISIQYVKSHSKDTNHALLAVQSPSQQDVQYSLNQMLQLKYKVQNITDRSDLLDLVF